MMNTGELIQNKKFNHKAFCIVYSILFGITWFISMVFTAFAYVVVIAIQEEFKNLNKD